MSAEDALLTDCAAQAEALARTLRADQAELKSTEGAGLISAVAERLEKIAALASPSSPRPPIISESSSSSL